MSGDPKAPLLSVGGLKECIAAGPCVVALVALWCPHCHQMYKDFVDAAHSTRDTTFAVVDADTNSSALEKVSVRVNGKKSTLAALVKSFPTLVRLEDGEATVFEGQRSQSTISKFARA